MHGNVRLTPRIRWTLVQGIQAGPPVAEVAADGGIGGDGLPVVVGVAG
jgi:hypothetical protein